MPDAAKILDDILAGKRKPAAPAGPAPLADLTAFAQDRGLTITSTTGGRHNPGSKHYDQKALDFSVKGLADEEVRKTMREAEARGYGARDERRRPPGQAVWGGPHVHLEYTGKPQRSASEVLDSILNRPPQPAQTPQAAGGVSMDMGGKAMPKPTGQDKSGITITPPPRPAAFDFTKQQNIGEQILADSQKRGALMTPPKPVQGMGLTPQVRKSAPLPKFSQQVQQKLAQNPETAFATRPYNPEENYQVASDRAAAESAAQYAKEQRFEKTVQNVKGGLNTVPVLQHLPDGVQDFAARNLTRVGIGGAQLGYGIARPISSLAAEALQRPDGTLPYPEVTKAAQNLDDEIRARQQKWQEVGQGDPTVTGDVIRGGIQVLPYMVGGEVAGASRLPGALAKMTGSARAGSALTQGLAGSGLSAAMADYQRQKPADIAKDAGIMGLSAAGGTLANAMLGRFGGESLAAEAGRRTGAAGINIGQGMMTRPMLGGEALDPAQITTDVLFGLAGKSGTPEERFAQQYKQRVNERLNATATPAPRPVSPAPVPSVSAPNAEAPPAPVQTEAQPNILQRAFNRLTAKAPPSAGVAADTARVAGTSDVSTTAPAPGTTKGFAWSDAGVERPKGYEKGQYLAKGERRPRTYFYDPAQWSKEQAANIAEGGTGQTKAEKTQAVKLQAKQQKVNVLIADADNALNMASEAADSQERVNALKVREGKLREAHKESQDAQQRADLLAQASEAQALWQRTAGKMKTDAEQVKQTVRLTEQQKKQAEQERVMQEKRQTAAEKKILDNALVADTLAGLREGADRYAESFRQAAEDQNVADAEVAAKTAVSALKQLSRKQGGRGSDVYAEAERLWQEYKAFRGEQGKGEPVDDMFGFDKPMQDYADKPERITDWIRSKNGMRVPTDLAGDANYIRNKNGQTSGLINDKNGIPFEDVRFEAIARGLVDETATNSEVLQAVIDEHQSLKNQAQKPARPTVPDDALFAGMPPAKGPAMAKPVTPDAPSRPAPVQKTPAPAKPAEAAPEVNHPVYGNKVTREQADAIERRAQSRLGDEIGSLGKLGELSRKFFMSEKGDRELPALAEHPSLRKLLDLPEMPPYRMEDGKTTNRAWAQAAQHTMDALAERLGVTRSSKLSDTDILRLADDVISDSDDATLHEAYARTAIATRTIQDRINSVLDDPKVQAAINDAQADVDAQMDRGVVNPVIAKEIKARLDNALKVARNRAHMEITNDVYGRDKKDWAKITDTAIGDLITEIQFGNLRKGEPKKWAGRQYAQKLGVPNAGKTPGEGPGGQGEKAAPVAAQESAPAKPAAAPEAKPEAPVGKESLTTEPPASKPSLIDNLDKAVTDAQERIKNRNKGRMSAGLDPADLADMSIIGAAKIAKGTVKFAQWSKEMAQELGDRVKPHLLRIWQRAQLLQTVNPIEDIVGDAKNMHSWREWYDSHQKLVTDLLGDDVDIFKRFLSVTSQASGVQTNVTLAVKAYRQYKSGEPFTGYMEGVRRNLERIRAQEDVSGLKISEYTKANADADAGAIAVDRHVAELLFGTQKPSAAQVEQGKFIVRTIADKMGWKGREAQAVLWAMNQIRKGAEPKSYGPYLRQKENEIAQIRATHSSGKTGSVSPGSRPGGGVAEGNAPKGNAVASQKATEVSLRKGKLGTGGKETGAGGFGLGKGKAKPKVSVPDDFDIMAFLETSDRTIKGTYDKATNKVKGVLDEKHIPEYDRLTEKMKDAYDADDGAAFSEAQQELMVFVGNHTREGRQRIAELLGLSRGLTYLGDLNNMRNGGNQLARSPGKFMRNGLKSLATGLSANPFKEMHRQLAIMNNREIAKKIRRSDHLKEEMYLMSESIKAHEFDASRYDESLGTALIDKQAKGAGRVLEFLTGLPLYRRVEFANRVGSDNMRLDVFEDLASDKEIKRLGLSTATPKEGLSPAANYEVLVARLTNALSGRGNIGHTAAQVGSLLTSARYIASFPDTINQGLRVIKASGYDWRVATKVGTYIGGRALLVYGVKAAQLALGGASATAIAKALTDTEDPDYLKFRIGDWTLDVSGGSAAYWKYAVSLMKLANSDMSSGKKAALAGKETLELGRNRLAPIPRSLMEAYSGNISKDTDENDAARTVADIGAGVLSVFVPIPYSTFGETWAKTEGTQAQRIGEGVKAVAVNTTGLSYNLAPKRREELPALGNTRLGKFVREHDINPFRHTQGFGAMTRYEAYPMRSLKRQGKYEQSPVMDRLAGKAQPPMESEANFKQRHNVANDMLQRLGDQMLDNPRFINAPRETQNRATTSLLRSVDEYTLKMKGPKPKVSEILKDALRAAKPQKSKYTPEIERVRNPK